MELSPVPPWSNNSGPQSGVKQQFIPPPKASRSGQESRDSTTTHVQPAPAKKPRRYRRKASTFEEVDDPNKRKCVSTACIACRKRKSKCDGNIPACAACSQVYRTECIYDPNSDHRRKGVYKKDAEGLKTRDSTLQILIQAILNYPEEDVPELVRQIRACESLDNVAESIVARENGAEDEEDEDYDTSPIMSVQPAGVPPTFETQLGTKMGELQLDDGSVRYIGGTSHLLFMNGNNVAAGKDSVDKYQQQDSPITSWSTVTDSPELVVHLLNMYFTWHYSFFTCISKSLFYRDFLLGKPPWDTRRKNEYCTPVLVNAMLALGCHFTSMSGARDDPHDSATAGDHFFREAKKLIMENDEHEKPKITTVQALALMSVREAGCGREAKGWIYSGMSFRMACDLGLHLESGALAAGSDRGLDEGEEDARRVTLWGCFLFDKCWSNYLGRLPQLPQSQITCPKYDVFPDEDSSLWTPCTDTGFNSTHVQPARTRAVALQITSLCEISSDIMRFFYNPTEVDYMSKPKAKQMEMKKLSDVHSRLETWRRNLPNEMEPKEGALSSVLIMHMFFQLLFIHLFRPFLKYNTATSPLPSNISPQRLCTQAATTISKLLRLYKRSYGLRQICNVCVYIAHTACTIHLLNLPNKDARRDIIHGVKHLEEIAEGWLCARRTLGILSTLARQWQIELPEEAATVLSRTDAKYGPYKDESTSAQPATTNGTSGAADARPDPPSSVCEWIAAPELSSQAREQEQQCGNNQDMQMLFSDSANLRPGNNSRPQAYVSPTTIYGHAPASTDPATMRPQSPINLNPSQYPSAHRTPGTKSSPFGMETFVDSNVASPSGIFGGVEQLLREGSDWVFQDQAQLGSGFGVGSGIYSDNAGSWNNTIPKPNLAPQEGPAHSVAGRASLVSNVNGGMMDLNAASGVSDGGMSGRGHDSTIPNANTNGSGFGSLLGYDEDQWYR